MAEFYRNKRKKVCRLCGGFELKFSNPDDIKRFVSQDKGKILPRRVTGTCAKHQRVVANEVKKARFMAILPFVK